MIKALAGGGGRGMRLVATERTEAALKGALRGASTPSATDACCWRRRS